MYLNSDKESIHHKKRVKLQVKKGYLVSIWTSFSMRYKYKNNVPTSHRILRENTVCVIENSKIIKLSLKIRLKIIIKVSLINITCTDFRNKNLRFPLFRPFHILSKNLSSFHSSTVCKNVVSKKWTNFPPLNNTLYVEVL